MTKLEKDIAFCIDEMNFSMNLEEIKEFGVKQNNGTWTGIIEKLRKKESDIGKMVLGQI